MLPHLIYFEVFVCSRHILEQGRRGIEAFQPSNAASGSLMASLALSLNERLDFTGAFGHDKVIDAGGYLGMCRQVFETGN